MQKIIFQKVDTQYVKTFSWLRPLSGLLIFRAVLRAVIIDDNSSDVQSASSWAPKVARKCESKHRYACGTDRRSVSHVITKFSEMGRLP